jgi:hypothetical protein
MPEDHPTKLAKPDKPYPEFPLFPHDTRHWAKKTQGKLHYFEPWSDPGGALKKYLAEKYALHAGRMPRPRGPDGEAHGQRLPERQVSARGLGRAVRPHLG